MSTQHVIGIIAIAMVFVIAIAWGRGKGPRVTQITRTTTRKKDRDDA
jgi:hypothetical protein